MKHIIKRALTLVLVLSVVCAMSITAFAAPVNKTISAGDDDTHTYEVYQIMVGDVSASGDKISNAVWGKNVKSTKGTAGSEVTEADMNAIMAVGESASGLADYVNFSSTSMMDTLQETRLQEEGLSPTSRTGAAVCSLVTIRA